MKKSLVLVAVIGLLVFAGLIYGINIILAQSDAVTITCEVLEGDSALAEGISFRIGNQLQEGLYWDSFVTVHQDAERLEVVTEFEDKWNERSDSVHYVSSYLLEEAIRLYIDGDYMVWNGGNIDFDAISNYSTVLLSAEEFTAIAERTEAGETHTEEFQLNKYLNYYDIYISENLRAGSYLIAGNHELAKDFFRLQIPDSHKYKVSITKDADGKIIQMGCGSESMQFESCSVQTADGLYFGFYGIKDEQVVDLTMGSGNGIFCIPLKPAMEETNAAYAPETTILYNQLVNAFPLPEKDCYPLELMVDEAEENLILLTCENKKAVLRIIDKATMKEKQKLELMDYAEMGIYYGHDEHQMDLVEEGLVIILNDNAFCFVSEENGSYEKKIVAKLGEGPGTNREKLYDMVYQDGRLVLLIAKGQSWSSEAYLYIMSQKGVEYKGHFVTSFDYENGGFGGIYLKEEQPLEILICQ